MMSLDHYTRVAPDCHVGSSTDPTARGVLEESLNKVVAHIFACQATIRQGESGPDTTDQGAFQRAPSRGLLEKGDMLLLRQVLARRRRRRVVT